MKVHNWHAIVAASAAFALGTVACGTDDPVQEPEATTSEMMSDDMSEDMSEEMSEHMSENMSEEMTEGDG